MDLGWHSAGSLTKETDARGVITEYSYDVLNRVTARSYPATPAEDVTYTYDNSAPGVHGLGRLTAISDESGTASLVYDARGNVVEETRVIGSVAYTTSYTYDLADDLLL